MAMTGVEALPGARQGDIVSPDRGGVGRDIDAIRRRELGATLMRMGDDAGAATAEAIGPRRGGRADEPPFVFLRRILVAHGGRSEEETDAPGREAFRFSPVGAHER
ncbi:hypothetical protein [Rubrimonas cliftonensis]|nr:hypothetical protein [Rubrimonas cliftonensis]